MNLNDLPPQERVRDDVFLEVRRTSTLTAGCGSNSSLSDQTHGEKQTLQTMSTRLFTDYGEAVAAFNAGMRRVEVEKAKAASAAEAKRRAASEPAIDDPAAELPGLVSG